MLNARTLDTYNSNITTPIKYMDVFYQDWTRIRLYLSFFIEQPP